MFIRVIRSVARFASGRRKFLQLTAASGGAAVLSGALKNVLAEPPGAAAQAKSAPASKGYRETAHVREYYNKARF